MIEVLAPLRILWLRTAVIAGMLAGLLLSPKLWLSSRIYPQTPVWSALHSLPQPVDRIVFGALILSLAVAALVPRSWKPLAVFFILAVALTSLDQSRWQPWFYQYLFMLAALALPLPSAVNTCRLIVVSVYFWSGMQKLNSGFVGDAFPWLMEPFKALLPQWAAPAIDRFGIVVPLAEIAIGLALLSRRYRTAALWVAATMHAFILLAIGPFGHNTNTVVWPWNLAMALSAFLLFWRTTDIPLRDVLWPKGAIFQRVVLVLFTIAPALSFFGAWDNYLSWALYAGNKDDADVYMTDAVYDKLPREIQEYVTEEGPDRNAVNLSTWSFGELNVPAYPETRVYKRVAWVICSYAGKPSEVTLVVQGKIALIHSRARASYGCDTLTGR